MDFIVIDASTDDIDPRIAALEKAGPMPFQVDTIGSVLAIDRALHGKNYIAARSVAEMVSKILMKLGGQNIGRLTIWDTAPQAFRELALAIPVREGEIHRSGF